MKKIIIGLIVVNTVLVYSCGSSTKNTEESSDNKEVTNDTFASIIDSQEVKLYHIENKKIKASFTNYGARIVTLKVQDKNGEFIDVILGYDSADEYKANNNNYYGAIVGRYGNRINQAKFDLDGVSYQLEQNDGYNSLHGGENGIYNKVWEVVSHSDSSITFSYLSPDGEAGYPGNVEIKVTYSLTDQGGLLIDYEALPDKNTVLNLTNHAYFNLNGAGDSTILDHELWINADKFTEINQNLIPTGKSIPVKGTSFDFTKAKLIGQDINKSEEQLKFGEGYDHNFELNTRSGFNEVAKVYSPRTGIEMIVLTTEPGLQFYSGNFMSDSDPKGKNGKVYPFRSAFCLETQHFPDSPNHLSFPSTVVKANELYETKTEYRFIIR